MTIGSMFLSGALSFAGGLFIARVVMPKIKKWIVAYIAKKRRSFRPYIDEKIKDPEFKGYVTELIFKAQKYLSEEDGEEKFNFVRRYVLRLSPDILDDYVDEIIQTIYEEIKKPLEPREVSL